MLSLTIFILLLALGFAASSAAVTSAAKAVGSEQARFKTGMAATFKIAIVEIALTSLTLAVSAPPTRLTLATALVAFVGSLAAAWIILRRSFGLTRPQTWAPFGARLATGLLMLALAAGVVRPYLAEAFILPTVSMSPGVEPGDRIVASKVRRDPRRWDVIVYRVSPEMAGSARERGPVKWCKRVVGLPGDRLVFRGDTLFVNDVVVAPPVPIIGQYHLSEPRYSRGIYNEGETIQLGPDEFFVLGDNVDHSADSRHHGPVKRAEILGVVDLRYWPPHRAAILR